jgi:NAD(P)-dependent dehydrogenase (short-subunit alcohol dehydrogenase family)
MTSPVVLITSALTDVGRASALAFAEEGVQIVVSAGQNEAGQQLVAEIRRLGSKAEFIRANVRHQDEVRELLANTVARFGRLDVAVNIADTESKPDSVRKQLAESDASFDTNVLGTLTSMIHQLDVMRPQSHGCIINVSFIHGQSAAGPSIYSICKHTLVRLTESSTPESDIQMNALASCSIIPLVYTKFTGVNQPARAFISTAPLFLSGRPEVIAHMIVFTASAEPSFGSGGTFVARGGKTTR